uniref:Protein kinase domain-containing protein n=1 Tax=Populus trichocarpa TaxID=3694 RepID=U7DWX0_POPTR
MEFPNDWENERNKPLKSLISDMLSINPDDRPSAEEVLPRVQAIKKSRRLDKMLIRRRLKLLERMAQRRRLELRR